jgi:serine/threonine-protein kinase HipA
MTSDPASCFVYITLPGATEPVTAGRFALSTNRRGVAEGEFVYGRSYLERGDAVPLDPVELRLGARSCRTIALNGVFGALRDASPDFWGRRVIQRHLGIAQPTELDYLLFSPDDRAGALGFGRHATPPAPRREFNQTLDLEALQAAADAILASDADPASAVVAQAENLMLFGTSMGGARPKAVVEDDNDLWIAKFNTEKDAWNNARVEHAMLRLARECGLATAESRIVTVGGRDVLLVKRFDREKAEAGYRRARMISGLTLLQTDDAPQARDRWSYVFMVEELRRVAATPKEDAHELFRRMCFNALISNMDDHPRNHALIARDRDWALSPAYDLTPAAPVAIERRDLAMSCGDLGRFANAKNLLSQSARFLLERDEASATVDTMERIVSARWYAIARETSVSPADCDRIAGAFAYPGFRRESTG